MTRSLKSLLAIVLVLAIGVPLWRFVLTAEPPPASIPPRDLGPVPVVLRELEPADVPLELAVFGNLEPVRRVALTSELTGRLERVHPAWRPGARVQEGEIVFALEERPLRLQLEAQEAASREARSLVASARIELEWAAESLQIAREQRVVAVREHERLQELVASGTTSESLVDRALSTRLDAQHAEEAARARVAAARSAVEAAEARDAAAVTAAAVAEDQLQRSRVHAPFGGHWVARAPVVGRWVAAGEPLGELVDVGRLLLSAKVPERELLSLRLGLEVRVRVPGTPETGPGLEVSGRLVSLPVQSDVRTRHGVVEIEVENPFATADANGTNGAGPSAYLPAGTFAEAVIDLGRWSGGVWIDRAHMVWREGRPVAYVLVAEGADGDRFVARERELELEREFGEGFLVSEGLAPGDTLVLQPLDRIEDGTACVPRPSTGAGP